MPSKMFVVARTAPVRSASYYLLDFNLFKEKSNFVLEPSLVDAKLEAVSGGQDESV